MEVENRENIILNENQTETKPKKLEVDLWIISDLMSVSRHDLVNSIMCVTEFTNILLLQIEWFNKWKNRELNVLNYIWESIQLINITLKSIERLILEISNVAIENKWNIDLKTRQLLIESKKFIEENYKIYCANYEIISEITQETNIIEITKSLESSIAKIDSLIKIPYQKKPSFITQFISYDVSKIL